MVEIGRATLAAADVAAEALVKLRNVDRRSCQPGGDLKREATVPFDPPAAKIARLEPRPP